MPWANLSPDRRRSVTLQLDYQHDPATEQDQQFWWDFFERENAIEKQIDRWEATSTPTASDLALKEKRISELRQELARMEAQKRQNRGDYYPQAPRAESAEPHAAVSHVGIDYIAYPIALHELVARLNGTPEEIAAWVWDGPNDGGLAAYLNANELDPPPRFTFPLGSCDGTGDDFDYMSPLMACWFSKDEVARFIPRNRYITGKALIEHWNDKPGLQPIAFIKAKIAESRLLEIHPIYGGTQATFSEDPTFPPPVSGLFVRSYVEKVDLEDFPGDSGNQSPANKVVASSNAPATDFSTVRHPGELTGDAQKDSDVGSPEWRKENARAAANARHSLPGGSREKQQKIREIWNSGKYTSRDLCAEQECAALDMSFSVARKALKNHP